jgi:dihydroorotate dehydrogenase
MYKMVRPLIFRKDPEEMHERILRAGKYLSDSWMREAIGFVYDFEDERLHTDAFGIEFRNPVGLAAGYDKNGELLDVLPYLGFGFAEIGSVTAGGGDGNPKPRLFRLVKDEAIMNRMGLNNNGADEIYGRLKGRKFRIPVGINIAKTHDPNILGDKAIEDFSYSFRKFHGIGDYRVINISCPNTSEGKTFEDRHALDELLRVLMGIEAEFEDKEPVFVKISPDVSYGTLDGILEVCERHGIGGYVICNTTQERECLDTDPEHIREIGKGGLSGRPLKRKSTEMIDYVYRNLNKPIIIGVGGISSGNDAFEKIISGASLLQYFTAMIYEGPSLQKRVNKRLLKRMKEYGFSSIKEAVGARNCI